MYAFSSWLRLQSFCILDICHSIQPGRRSPCVASSLHGRQSICEGVTDIWWFKLQKWSRTNYERLGSAQRFWAEMTLPLEPGRFGWALGATSLPRRSLRRTSPHRSCSLRQSAAWPAECQFSFPGAWNEKEVVQVLAYKPSRQWELSLKCKTVFYQALLKVSSNYQSRRWFDRTLQIPIIYGK